MNIPPSGVTKTVNEWAESGVEVFFHASVENESTTDEIEIGAIEDDRGYSAVGTGNLNGKIGVVAIGVGGADSQRGNPRIGGVEIEIEEAAIADSGLGDGSVA